MKKIIFITLGILMIIVGVVGIILPVLPTTIFLILAAYFFSHSSPDLYSKLMRNKTFGPIIRNYRDYRGITKSDRTKALITIWIIFGISMLISKNPILISILIIVGVVHTIYLFKLNLIDNNS